MNILHISSDDLVGGRFNGYYMNQSLDKTHNVEMAVWNKKSMSSYVHLIPPGLRGLHFAAAAVMKLSSRVGFDGIAGSGGWLLSNCDYVKRTDIIHLQKIHGFSNISILSLPRLSQLKPVVWTLHDIWAMTGGCEHSLECDRWLSGCSPRCPHPRCRSLFQHYTPYVHWKIKKKIYRNSKITLVVASQWMKDRVERSPLMNHLPCHYIPFGIDTNLFTPRSKAECRMKLGIPMDHKVIAFRDIGVQKDKYKGTRWLLEALKLYDPKVPTSLLIFEGGKSFYALSPKYNVVTTGWIDGESLVNAFSAADVFLMPSIQESFGLMAVEAMSCGVPVIVFDGTALPDVIKSPVGGLAVPAKNAEALMFAIKQFLENEEIRNKVSIQARELAVREYSFPLYVQRHVDLYQQVIEQHKNKGRT